MKNYHLVILLLLASVKGFTQNQTEKDFVILTFEMDRNKDSHGTFVYYWVAELSKYEKVDEYKKPELYSFFLHEFYSSDQLESCCLGEASDPYTMTTNSKFNFSENYSEYLNHLRKLVNENRKQIQVINKEWKDGFKEKITVYATAVRGKLCECTFMGKTYIKNGEKISFPIGNYQILKNYLTDDKRVLLFMDFSNFDYENTDYRTSE